ncbi:MAG TPA: GNAT family N-acetyltransferase [Sporolactobacillaceae bacterium]|nr:GNAT family N-acetyltransferase [Sporolactobacillaceae bacterium]
MEIQLVRATERDAEAIFDLQVKAFLPLLEIYRDFDTNPATETIDRVISRINRPNGGFYKIFADDVLVGGICVYWKEDIQFWISPIFISPEFQGRGIAQKTMALMEAQFPQAISWELKTILEEKRNCYLYEKMGYRMTGDQKMLNETMTLVHYKKII